MLRDGKYAAWFRTSRGEGTGIVHLVDGKISGGDSFFNYCGSYEIDDDRFTATLTTHRFADGPTTVFGLDDVELKLNGILKGTIASCSGTSEQAPGVLFEATLFLGQEQPLRPAPQPLPSSFNVTRLPKGMGGRYRARNPFIPAPER